MYTWVFERLVNGKIYCSISTNTILTIECVDPTFRATQEIEFNNRLISAAEVTIVKCEDELLKLTEIQKESSTWSGNSSSRRSQYLLKKMMDAERKLEDLEMKNVELKKTLAKLS